ncbi:polyserase-related [Holotrichia oblita]|uniref:Polyserase-related n=1 Tax=Holotrichia oblita TaxID=644536 RepID=A0ACB9TM68_HOLOL|nr:polyserase-related [Holotrichia oblita]
MGVGKIVDRISQVTYLVKIDCGNKVIHADCLKPRKSSTAADPIVNKHRDLQMEARVWRNVPNQSIDSNDANPQEQQLPSEWISVPELSPSSIPTPISDGQPLIPSPSKTLLPISAKQFDVRIVGGKEMTIEKVPYLVMILCRNMFIVTKCGGVLLNKKTVLTAAHCVLICSKDDLIVIAGSTTEDLKYGHEVNSITLHPRYHEVDNDIAVLCLKFSLKYSERIQPISIANQLYPEGTNAVVSGWGDTGQNDDKRQNKLRIVNVQLISNHHCEWMDPFLTERQLCTANDGHGPCRVSILTDA